MNTRKQALKAFQGSADHPGPDQPTSFMNPDAYLGTCGAAAFLGISTRWLEKLRQEGGGPRYSKPSRRKVLYRIRDLQAWADQSRRMNTTQEGIGNYGEVE